MRKLFLMCQTTGPAETRFLADPLAFWQTHCRCSFAHACGKNGEQWTISRSQGPVMDGCLPDPDKKYPFRSDGPANFAFSEAILVQATSIRHTMHTPVLYCTPRSRPRPHQLPRFAINWSGSHPHAGPYLATSCAVSCQRSYQILCMWHPYALDPCARAERGQCPDPPSLHTVFARMDMSLSAGMLTAPLHQRASVSSLRHTPYLSDCGGPTVHSESALRSPWQHGDRSGLTGAGTGWIWRRWPTPPNPCRCDERCNLSRVARLRWRLRRSVWMSVQEARVSNDGFQDSHHPCICHLAKKKTKQRKRW